MATITCLPEETIDKILGYNSINIEDIINFRCVCKQFRWAGNYEKFWEKKLLQRWPLAKFFYDKNIKKMEQENKQKSITRQSKDKIYSNFVTTGMSYVRELRTIQSFCDYEDSFDVLIDNHKYATTDDPKNEYLYDKFVVIDRNLPTYFVFKDELMNLINQSLHRRSDCNLNELYSNERIYNYMCSIFKQKMLGKALEIPIHKRLLEHHVFVTIETSFFLGDDAQLSPIGKLLDNIALEVLNYLREKHPDHSIFSTSDETFTYWKRYNIDDNHWGEIEATQIMDALEEYMFDKLNFRGFNFMQQKTKNVHKRINMVIENKYGADLIVLVIYHGVARRLGILCLIMRFTRRYIGIVPSEPYIYCLYWRPSYSTHYLANYRCFSIRNGKFPDCLRKQSIEQYLSYPGTIVNIMDYLHDDLMSMYECSLRIQFNLHDVILSRSEEVKFAIGMIVTYSVRSSESIAGVIIGWHRYEERYIVEIDLHYRDDEVFPLNFCCVHDNYLRNNCTHFPNCVSSKEKSVCNTKHQTHYLILTEHDEMSYVGEDAISLTTPKWINNSETGRYFSKFEGTHYVPNKSLAKHYPQDAAVTISQRIM